MTRVALVFHSGYGHTERLAHAVGEGIAATPNVDADTISIDPDGQLTDHDWHVLDAADGVVFGSPTYMGCISWQFKKFADASSKRWAEQAWKDKIAAGFTNSGSLNGDKHSTLHYLFTLAMQHGMIWVGSGMMPANKKVSTREDINYLGAFAGVMSQSPADASPEEAPFSGDLETARRFGARIAETTRRCANAG
ncbi:flavodoxin family protein [Salinisphaera hydrothermalis]|uniref:flavodoxin family protein n=1 Tax=Salinisphaera hydrothermalis TaxID=563188 RepID=UPI00333FFB46